MKILPIREVLLPILCAQLFHLFRCETKSIRCLASGVILVREVEPPCKDE